MSDPPPSRTILLVDDDTTLRLVTMRLLQSLGYVVYPAPSSAAGLEAFVAMGDQVDLLITDLALPGMDGRELAAEVQRRCRSARVLFITGWATGGGRDSDALVGGMPILGKPFSRQQLEVAVLEALA